MLLITSMNICTIIQDYYIIPKIKFINKSKDVEVPVLYNSGFLQIWIPIIDKYFP